MANTCSRHACNASAAAFRGCRFERHHARNFLALMLLLNDRRKPAQRA
jgi:hypothetical protein